MSCAAREGRRASDELSAGLADYILELRAAHLEKLRELELKERAQAQARAGEALARAAESNLTLGEPAPNPTLGEPAPRSNRAESTGIGVGAGAAMVADAGAAEGAGGRAGAGMAAAAAAGEGAGAAARANGQLAQRPGALTLVPAPTRKGLQTPPGPTPTTVPGYFVQPSPSGSMHGAVRVPAACLAPPTRHPCVLLSSEQFPPRNRCDHATHAPRVCRRAPWKVRSLWWTRAPATRGCRSP